ncbi:MAG: trypsin-like peptidase domain-containing protein [Kaiparowitsia implicata GSE-PSE-MK54-09C]|nr:trypsin-like peptidase domain-containing protein [Kaiparowitsia implicata GSE-PSE-MK54-09C]
MRFISSRRSARLVLASAGAAMLALGMLANLSAQAQSVVGQSLRQVQRTAAEKVLAFGLTPNPEPYIPAGLSQSSDPRGGRGVIGLRDDRTQVTSSHYPWSAIGRLQSPAGERYIDLCTGSLVAPDVVLTNAHCVVNPETHQVKTNITFHPNMVNGRVREADHIANVVDIIYGTNFSDESSFPHPNDWAFVKLDRPLGNTYGTLAWSSLSVSELVRNHRGGLTTVGYSGDFPAHAPGRTAGVHQGCNVLGEVEDSLIHDCDTHGGSSGGPMLAVIDGEFRIVGLNSAERTDRQVNASTGETIQSQGIVNYGVKIDPIVSFIRQAF